MDKGILEAINDLKDCCRKLILITDNEMEKITPYIYEDEMAYIKYVNADMIQREAKDSIKKADEFINLVKTTSEL